MKKILFILFLIPLLTLDVNALEIPKTTISYIGNGIYVETTIEDCENQLYATNTVTKTKTNKYKNANGTVLYSLSVKGTFTYNGKSSTCTSSSVTATAYTSDWKVASKSATKSGNKATAKATMKQYYNGNHVQTLYPSVTLTCSATGVFS